MLVRAADCAGLRRGLLGDLRSPLDYRAIFTRLDGRWQMTAFLPGD